MATMSFCGATGKMFRGRSNEQYRWQRCTEPERPEGNSPEEDWMNRCDLLECPMYLTAVRRNNREPYRWSETAQHRWSWSPVGIVVTGSPEAEANRIRCGVIVRANLAAGKEA